MAAQVSFIARLFNLLQGTGSLSFDQGNILRICMSDDVNTFFSPLVKIGILLFKGFLQELIKYKVFTTESKDFFSVVSFFCHEMSSVSEPLWEQRCCRKGSYTIFLLCPSGSFHKHLSIPFGCFLAEALLWLLLE